MVPNVLVFCSLHHMELHLTSVDWFIYDWSILMPQIIEREGNINLFQTSVAFYIDTRHMISCANQTNGIYMQIKSGSNGYEISQSMFKLWWYHVEFKFWMSAILSARRKIWTEDYCLQYNCVTCCFILFSVWIKLH